MNVINSDYWRDNCFRCGALGQGPYRENYRGRESRSGKTTEADIADPGSLIPALALKVAPWPSFKLSEPLFLILL